MGFADSFFSRAKSTPALHWNPANIGEDAYLQLPVFNTNINITNNLLNMDMNGLSGKFLTDKDKEDILKEIDGTFVADGSFRTLIIGISDNNFAFSMGVNALASSKVSEEFIRISLYGTDSDNYNFNDSDFGYDLLSYADITAGVGAMKLAKLIPSLDRLDIPEIEYGISGSLLTGITNITSSDFIASYSSNIDDGLNTEACLMQKEAFGGFGLKFNLSFNSQINENLTAGMGFDNVLGFIRWTGKTRVREKMYWIDGAYISNLEDDILSDDESVKDIPGYTTNLPLIYRFGTLYDFGKIDISLDYSHTFNKNNYNLGRNKIALATELKWINGLPFQLGIKLGDGDNLITTAYGVSFEGDYFQTGLSMQLADTLWPGKNSKSLSFALHTQLKLN